MWVGGNGRTHRLLLTAAQPAGIRFTCQHSNTSVESRVRTALGDGFAARPTFVKKKREREGGGWEGRAEEIAVT